MSGAEAGANAADDTASPHRRWPTHLALAAVVGAFGATAGLPGLFAGGVVALVGRRLDAPFAVATGHVLLLPLFPQGIEPVAFGLVEAALLVLLWVPANRPARRAPLRSAAGCLIGAGALAGVAWLAFRTQPLWLAAGSLTGCFVLVASALHRYERVRLGLVTPDERTPDT